EQLLQVVETFRELRPFAGEFVVRAIARAQFGGALARDRYLLGRLGAQRGLLDLHRLLLLLLLGGERGGDAALLLVLEIDRVLLVDIFLLVRRRIGTGDVEGAVLHEVVIGVAAAGLAPAGELGVAFGKRAGLFLLGGQLLGRVSAFLEIRRRTTPPLRRNT